MKKFLLSFLFVVGFGGYALYNHLSTAQASGAGVALPTPATNDTSGGITIVTNPTSGSSAPPPSTNTGVTTKPTPTPTPTPAPVPKPKGQYADGSYTGSVADAYYGNVQVRVTVSGGKIAGVSFLQYPNDRDTSRYINSQAMPLLQEEAIQAQSANIDGVSGASDTSAAFQQSLASALAKARA